MKKRLLITSIVMMLVVAVALSTATYAWFTSNARVDAASLTMKAATSDANALGIGWLGGDSGTSIESNLYEVLRPMAPDSLTVGTTTSDVIFRNASVREEGSQIVFNDDVISSYVQVSSLPTSENSDYYVLDNGTRKAKADVEYYDAIGDVFPATVTVNTTDVGSKYIKNFAPTIYNNESVQAFYVKNLSEANTINKVTVYASFTATNAYILTKDTTFKAGSKYYTRSGDVDNYSYTLQTVVDDNAGANEVVKGAAVTADTYYEEINGNDLVRIALFTKSAYKLGTDTPAESYTLLGVLGNNATSGTSVGNAEFDKNTTYYTRSGSEGSYVYTQNKSITAANYDENKANLYTCENTAVFGAASLFEDNDAVKDLDHYTNVATSLTLATNIAPLKQVDIVAVAWLDGTLLDDEHASVIGQVSLYFNVG